MEQITAAMIFEFIALLGGGIAAWTKINQEDIEAIESLM
jgi:hypothetical protein